MVPAKHRLRGDANFQRLMSRGRAFFSSFLTVRLVPNKEKVSRFAFVVSAKTSKKAVERNKLKRKLREIVRLELVKIRPGYDILIAGRKPALGGDYWTLKKELFGLLKKARLTEQ
jgi:ribonuclease P protein component